jgi:acyl-CoA synthetase (AMP-forming)/AMP-acid ligase II
MFIRGGYNVYPMEVEGALGTHPQVAQVVVVPRPDPVMGEIGVAVVVPLDPADPPSLESLREHGRRSLSAYKLPEAITFVDEIPLAANSKIDRRTLTDQVADPNG